jgi:hypothetical protein
VNKIISFKSLIAVLALSATVFAAPGDAYIPGTYLIKTQWRGHAAPYTDQTPRINGEPTAVGCVMVGYSQIMNYYKWPPRAIDTIPAYTSRRVLEEEIQVPALLPFDFDWDNMTDTYGNTSTEKQKNAVAALMSAAGKAAVANYSRSNGTGSNQNKALRALVRYFDYDYREIKYLARNDGYSASEWEQIMRDQIDKGLPVLYGGKDGEVTDEEEDVDGVGGHVYILDGYDNSGNFHFNWGGGGGTADGFYAITVNGTAGGTFKYRYNQRAVINIRPGGHLPGNHLRKAAINGGKYILEADVDGNDKLTLGLIVKNDFILDLNGHALTIEPSLFGEDGIKIASGKTFTIMDSKSSGVLNVINAYSNYAGINTTDGTLIIESGTVNAKGGSNGAGIGGGRDGAGGKIIIAGGTVNATSGGYGAGIGGGRSGSGGAITITGGIVTAIGGSSEGYSNSGAGIGGGDGGSGGVITINGGTVTATGGKRGAGIGGGRAGNGETITITGGTITATGGGTGIGGGYDGTSGGNITISGGTVTATSVDYGAGIGGGRGGNGGEITITGGTVTATGGERSAGIGGGSGVGSGGNGGNITISGGMVTATSGNTSGSTSAKGIGNGQGSTETGTLAMDGNALVFTNSIGDATAKTSGILVIGNTTNWYGENTITLSPTQYAIPSGKTLTIQNGKTLEIPSGAMLTNNGTIVNNGTIANSGTITLCGGTLTGNPVEGNQPISTCPATITAHPTGGTATIGKAFTLSVTATSPDGGTLSYQWFIKTPEGEATAIAGATNATYAAPTSSIGTYKYFVVVTNTVEGSVSVASNVATLTVVEATTPILTPKIATGNRLITPTRNGITFTAKANATIAVYSMSGKLVSKQIYNAGSHSISFGHLPKGMYIVRASFGNRNEVLRVAVR